MSVTPRSRSTDQRYYGVAPAIVEVAEGDDECRVKLSLPWFDPGTVTDWCPVVQPYAGGGYGFCFVPEQGDEVLVAFVHGDMRFPIVLGGLYNGVDKPPTARKDGRDQKLIRTKHGHQVLLDDQQSQAAVRVTSAAGHVVELDDQGKEIRIKAAAGASVSVTADGRITLDSKAGVTLKAPQVSIEAKSVSVGDGAGHPVPFGDVLVGLFNAHVHPSAAGPTSTPTPPIVDATVLSTVVRTG
ncbi:type IV secretion protein Rhs [Actinoplanes sp. ATCC 53533]|uniref:phage baseplate assembly protein V n=1 Tax=Actinoplanes sp. ATCC 53533 TaxID=1288362 RepID=UPI000F796CD5|nr:phage baseplate assembly protein V [Actinoplanes sp. ATCC 53533]RSM64732.1 type IV secretion protein Rhs [Actinoplanes sp. ATCC 53533]